MCENNLTGQPVEDLLVAPQWFDFRLKRDVIDTAGAYGKNADGYWIPGRCEAKASFPIVPDGSQNVPADRDALMWRPAYGAVSGQVFFGETEGVLEKMSESDQCAFKLPGFGKNKMYVWRVDSVMPDGAVIKGDCWYFSTR